MLPAQSLFAAGCMLGYNDRWRAPAHCGMVYLVRSGTKQPKPFTASAADQARLLFFSPCSSFPLLQASNASGVPLFFNTTVRTNPQIRQFRLLLCYICAMMFPFAN
jgi:hypothetical protein